MLKALKRQLAKAQRQTVTSRDRLTSSASDEWYTPPEYIERVRHVMGRNDLDPASTAVAQQWIQATAYYTLEGNGLAQDWRGRVWLNPPYGKQIGRWVDKTLNEYRQGNMNGHPVESTFEEHVRGGNYVEVGGKGWERAVNILIALASAGIGVLLFLLLG